KALIADRSDVFVSFRLFLEAAVLSLHHKKQPFYSHDESSRSRELPSAFSDKIVISSSAVHRSLCSYAVVHKLEYRPCIIIKTSYDLVVHLVFYTHLVKYRLDRLKMLSAFGAEIIKHDGSVGYYFLAFFFLAVQHPERVLLKSGFTVI